MADLSVQTLSAEGGGAITFANAAGGGDKFIYDAAAHIVIRNDDASSKTVTVTPGTTSLVDTQNGLLAKNPIALAVAAGAVAVIPPLPSLFKNGSDLNKVAITYSAVTSLKIAIVKTAK